MKVEVNTCIFFLEEQVRSLNKNNSKVLDNSKVQGSHKWFCNIFDICEPNNFWQFENGYYIKYNYIMEE